MVNWFGPAPWGAPVNFDTPRCETPVGTVCLYCQREIGELDSGYTMPYLKDLNVPDQVASYHRHCFLKSITDHKFWPDRGLVPDPATDGFLPVGNGDLQCPTCGMTYSPSRKEWMA